MKKSSRKAPKRKRAHSHKKNARSEHAHEGTFHTAPVMETRILTDDEKHELIRAHAENRAHRKSLGLGYYVAVGLSCLIVGGGWLLTFEENLGLNAPAKADPAIESVRDGIQSFKNNAAIRLPEVRKDFDEAKAQFATYAEEAEGQSNTTSTELETE